MRTSFSIVSGGSRLSSNGCAPTAARTVARGALASSAVGSSALGSSALAGSALGSSALASIALAVVALSGCGPSKVAECTELNTKINQGVEKIEKTTTGKGDQEASPADLKAMADTMDKIAEDLSKAKTTIPELKEYSKKYQEMSKTIAKAARETATALEAKDPEKVTKAQDSLEKATQPEEALVEGINKFCEAP